MPKDPVLKLLLVWIIACALFIGCGMIFSSCQVLKKKQSTVKDSVSVNKIDSGQVRVNTTTAKDSTAWWRDIFNFLPRDTVINNITTPVNNYPVQIIREGGVRTSEVKQVNYDSLWNNRLDSLSMRLTESSKSKETKVLTQWYIWVILGLLGLIAFKSFFKVGLK